MACDDSVTSPHVRRIRELEAENAKFREALELIRLDVNEIDRMRTCAEKAEAEVGRLKALAKRPIPNSAAICPICLSEMVCLTPHKHKRIARMKAREKRRMTFDEEMRAYTSEELDVHLASCYVCTTQLSASRHLKAREKEEVP